MNDKDGEMSVVVGPEGLALTLEGDIVLNGVPMSVEGLNVELPEGAKVKVTMRPEPRP